MTLPHFQVSHTKRESTSGNPRASQIPHRPVFHMLYPTVHPKWWERHRRSQVWVPPSLYQTLEMYFSDHLTIYPVRSCVHMFSLRFSSSRILFFCWSLISFPCLSHSYSSQCILFTTQRGEPIANLWSGCCKAKINGSGGMTWVYRTLRWLTPSPSLICTFCCCTWRAA